MSSRRILRLNNLLQEVISETIHREVKNPHVGSFPSVARVEISPDLHHAKVFISILGNAADREKTLAALRSASGFIAVHSAKKVNLRYFPELSFHLDTTVDQLMHIEEILRKVRPEGDRGGE
ncbi:MAG: 30S ribosome-binding factor RbfA [Chlamydiia bacterium]